jgi:hypothetical protein
MLLKETKRPFAETEVEAVVGLRAGCRLHPSSVRAVAEEARPVRVVRDRFEPLLKAGKRPSAGSLDTNIQNRPASVRRDAGTLGRLRGGRGHEDRERRANSVLVLIAVRGSSG